MNEFTWIDADKEKPQHTGAYLIAAGYLHQKKVVANLTLASYKVGTGWMVYSDVLGWITMHRQSSVRYWAHIPELPKDKYFEGLTRDA